MADDSEDSGGGLGIGGIAGLLSSLSGLGNLGLGIASTILGGRQSQQSKLEQERWERFREPVGEQFKTSYYAPTLAGTLPPYGTWTPRESYNWTPSPAMEQLYSYYLNREYGLPENVARSQVASSLGPIRMSSLPNNAVTPSQVGSAIGQSGGSNAQQLAQSLLGTKTPAIQRQIDYLSNAAQLSQFNLQRLQQLPSLIG